jgi:hypothetical protein
MRAHLAERPFREEEAGRFSCCGERYVRVAAEDVTAVALLEYERL